MALDFSLQRLAGVIENLLVYPDRMKTNLERTGGLVFSQRVLLALTQMDFHGKMPTALFSAAR
jgi:adenylosuccinate lyase